MTPTAKEWNDRIGGMQEDLCFLRCQIAWIVFKKEGIAHLDEARAAESLQQHKR